MYKVAWYDGDYYSKYESWFNNQDYCYEKYGGQGFFGFGLFGAAFQLAIL